MSPKKSTITRDSVFRSTGGTSAPKQGVTPAEPAHHQTATWLGDEDVEWLDDRCKEIKRGGWRSVTRSALIRALIRAAREQPLDLTGVAGEAELVQRLAAR